MSHSYHWFWDGAFALVAGFLAVNTTLGGIQNWKVERQLQCCSITVQAQVINRWETKGGNDPLPSYQYYVSYTFDGPHTITKDAERIDWKTYENVVPGEPIAVQYMASDPAISRILENTNQFPYLEMATLWWLIFLATLWSLSLKLRHARQSLPATTITPL